MIMRPAAVAPHRWRESATASGVDVLESTEERSAQTMRAASPGDRVVYRRAIEAAIWGLPIVAFDAMRQAFLRDAGARFNDVVYWPKPADWRLQLTVPTAACRYVYVGINTKSGPVVVDVPPADGAGLFGSINDAWQVPRVDVGPAGADEGWGAKYLLLPPGYRGAIPEEYYPVRLPTYNACAMLRVIPITASPADLTAVLDLIANIHAYPLAMAKSPRQRHIDLAGKVFDAIPRFDATFYARLARMIQEEPVQPRDLVAMGLLRSLGIAKDRDFVPDADTTEILEKAIAEAHVTIMRRIFAGQRFWSKAHWTVAPGIGAKTAFTFETPERLATDERAVNALLGCAPPRKLGAAWLDIFAMRDASGAMLEGDGAYCLRIPASVPVQQLWSVSVYDLNTAAFLRTSPRVEVCSQSRGLRANADGSVEVHFSPKPHPGGEANWIHIAPGRAWFAAMHFARPERALFDRTWHLPDLERSSP